MADQRLSAPAQSVGLFSSEFAGPSTTPEQQAPGNKQTRKRKKHSMKKIIALTTAMVALSAWTAGAADVKALYEKECTKCHGDDGKGQTKMGKKLGAKD